jgi:outer membrane protein assembly factor BamE (lipoprotein component of BamABCDE complex)
MTRPCTPDTRSRHPALPARSARRDLPSLRRALALGALVAAAAWIPACVTYDNETGEYIPRGNQRYEFSKVVKAADELRTGMTKAQVLLLLGSPAEKDEGGDRWIYLPERYAILVPARALQLDFKDSALVEHGYRAIVLGTRL